MKPGEVAAMDAGGGQQRGSVQLDVVVPDFSKPPISLSGIAISSIGNSLAPTSGSADRWKSAGIPPTTMRVFGPLDELRVLVEAYERYDPKAGSAIVSTTVTNSSGSTLFRGSEELPASTAPTSKELVTKIPLNGFPPGDYLLTVEAKNGKGQDRRQLPFSVREEP